VPPKRQSLFFDVTLKSNKNNKYPRANGVINNKGFMIFMTLLTIYALFFDDIRILLFPKEIDDLFNALTLLTLSFFVLEIVLYSLARNDYLFSFFFWLDCVQAISLIFDVGWIFSNDNSLLNLDATQLVQSSRAARVTRIIRVLRLVRLTRIVKLYKQAKIAEEKRILETEGEFMSKRRKSSMNVMRP